MDKVNIGSSQAILEMSSISVDTRSMSSSPLVNSLVKNQLFIFQDRTRHRWADVSIRPHYGFVCCRHDAAWQPRSRNSQDWDLGCFWRPHVGRKKVWCFLTQQFNVCTCAARCAGALSCWKSCQTLCVSLAAVWRHCDIMKPHKKSVRDITRISCFVTTMKLPHACIADLFNSFCEEVYTVAFFKTVQQHAISEVGNSIMCLWAANFCLQQWKNY